MTSNLQTRARKLGSFCFMLGILGLTGCAFYNAEYFHEYKCENDVMITVGMTSSFSTRETYARINGTSYDAKVRKSLEDRYIYEFTVDGIEYRAEQSDKVYKPSNNIGRNEILKVYQQDNLVYTCDQSNYGMT